MMGAKGLGDVFKRRKDERYLFSKQLTSNPSILNRKLKHWRASWGKRATA
jgi:hypothetical protein